VIYAFEDQDVVKAAKPMEAEQMHRLVVLTPT
jgi:hypothetical protein